MSARESRGYADGLTLRPFRLADRDELLALNSYGLTAAGIKISDDYYEGEDFADLEKTYSVGAGGVMVVGETNGRIVAMGGIRRADETTCELLRMRVYPEHQGRGYGTAVLAVLEQEATRLGYRRIELLTGEEQHPAVEMYARHGYSVIGREMLIGIPSVRMAKDIGAA